MNTIAIDLGTTNCTLSEAMEDESGKIKVKHFDFEQLTALDEKQSLKQLPSFLYAPLENERAELGCEEVYIIGAFAKSRALETSGRVISSAKSWLCQGGGQGERVVLPLEASQGVWKLSAFQAIENLLAEIKNQWNQRQPKSQLEQQDVVITVPASFDPYARSLVEKAAHNIGLKDVYFLEEPQAALYQWLYKNENQWRQQLAVDDRILVIDIGGGTTDFSLVQVQEEKGQLIMQRKAVGEHLLLGGDNIDLALAYMKKRELQEKGKTLSNRQFSKLVGMCQAAKEQLFEDEELQVYKGSLLQEGSSIFSQTISFEVSKEEINQLVLDGFFPKVSIEEQVLSNKGAGLVGAGLPYAKDPRMSVHIAHFLKQQQDKQSQSSILPHYILVNGGVFKASAIHERLKEIFASWASTLQVEPPVFLEVSLDDLDLSVSQGAAYFGLARLGKGVRIKANSPYAYFIGVENNAPAIPGFTPECEAVCIAPFGMEEGESYLLEDQYFNLLVGEESTFRFFRSSKPKNEQGQAFSLGMRLNENASELEEIAPLTVCFESSEQSLYQQVKLKATFNELGSLELHFNSSQDESWKLEFSVRESKTTSLV